MRVFLARCASFASYIITTMSFISKQNIEVIDLVSSDEENEALSYATVVFAGNKKKRSRTDDSSFHNNHRALKKGHVKNQNDTIKQQQQHQSCVCMPFINADVPDNAVVTDDWMSLLARLSSKSPGQVRTCAGQSTSPLFHIQQKDKWSCGYRNLQMLLVVLLPLLGDTHAYHVAISIPESLSIPNNTNQPFRPIPIPSLYQLQVFLETSWNVGFDKRGAEHYHYNIVGKSCFIGAIEVSTMLSYLWMDNVVIQFVKIPESKALLAPFVWNYFSQQETCLTCRGNKNVSCATYARRLLERCESRGTLFTSSSSSTTTTTTCCSCPLVPLYLQWQGHSATIVGVEKMKSGNVNFLVLDPLENGYKLKQALTYSRTIPKMMVLSSKSLLHKDVQLVMANSTRPLSPEERNAIRNDGNFVTAAEEKVRQWNQQQQQQR